MSTISIINHKNLKPLMALMALIIMGCTADPDIEEPSDGTPQGELRTTLTRLFGSVNALILPDSDDYEAIPQDPRNRLTESKVLLGKFLFHETAIGVKAKYEEGLKTYSCASCHHAVAGFQAGKRQGIGDGGWGFGSIGETRIPNSNYDLDSIDIQPIRSPTILNVAYQEVMLWNGQFGSTGVNEGTEANWLPGTPIAKNELGFEGVETQAIAGMGVHRQNITSEVILNQEYKALFDAAYATTPAAQRYTLVNSGLAMAAYERTVLANQAPFQEFLKGNNNAMSEEEIKGANLFFGKAKCYQCHQGPALNDMKFHALGMEDLVGEGVVGDRNFTASRGRGGFTNNQEDDFKFKTPTLYNLKDVNFLGHGGTFTNVRDVIVYKNLAIKQNPTVPQEYLSEYFKPLGLSQEEINQLTAFIENSLQDPNLSRYVPDATPLGTTCFPNADAQSLEDLGCN